MRSRNFKCGAAGHIRSAVVRAIIIFFILAFLFIFVAGDFDAVGGGLYLALICSFVWEAFHTCSITVSPDGVSYLRNGKSPVFYKFANYYFSESGSKTALRAEHRSTSKVEELQCFSFSKPQFKEMLELIKQYQSSYFTMRSQPGAVGNDNFSGNISRQPGKTSAPTASDYAKNNPYSKEYKNRAVKQLTVDDMPKSAPAAPKPETIAADVPKPETVAADVPKSETVVTAAPEPPKPAPAPKSESIKPKSASVTLPEADKNMSASEHFAKDIPADYNKIPEMPAFDDTAYRNLPEIGSVGGEISSKEFTHEHGEDFHKSVFYYPRRAITEQSERANVLSVLYILAAGVIAFLAWYLIFGGSGLEGKAALIIAVICVSAIAITLIVRGGRTRNLFSKLEITRNHLVIDNVRYRFAEMTNMRMTSPDESSGVRRISFTYDGKGRVYTLGPCKKSGRAEDYFNRYAELCDLLRDRGFE